MMTLGACSMFEGPTPLGHDFRPISTHYQLGQPYAQDAGYYAVTPNMPTQSVSVGSSTHTYSYGGAYGANQVVCCAPGPQYLPNLSPHLRGMQNIDFSNTYEQLNPGQIHAYGQTPSLRGMQNQNSGHFYGTLGGVLYDDDAETFGIEGRIGFDSGHVFGAEIEGSFGVIEEESIVNEPTIGDVDLKTQSNYNFATFAVARAPITHGFSLHGRVGYDMRQLRVNAKAKDGRTATVSGNFKGLAYGVGAEYDIAPRSGIRVDVTRYENNIGSIESISASFKRKF